MSIAQQIAQDLGVSVQSVSTAITLLNDGATVPFIARYRKEATNGLDDTQLRFLEERLFYLREMTERREAILKSITEQGLLTETLKQAIEKAETKTLLEDLYLPYRPKRHTKAHIAREAGLEPLATLLWKEPLDSAEKIETTATAYINAEKGIENTAAALDGARQILMEIFSEEAGLLDRLRENFWQQGVLSSTVIKGKEKTGNKYTDYFDYKEPIKNMPSHRILALLRGRREGILRLSLDIPGEDINDNHAHSFNLESIIHQFQIDKNNIWLKETVRLTWKIKILPKLEQELMTRLREIGEEGSMHVFAKNLRDLLLSAPAGEKATMGLDPGIRTGVKVAVIDSTGKVLDTTVVYPHAPQNDWHGSIAELAKLAMKHGTTFFSIGNGTASRETSRLTDDLLKMYPDLTIQKVIVNEAGASVYSASEYASQEFPDMDVTLRGAVSIARRLQDPLAELVKIEPKAIGVGQYQHDVNQSKLGRTLDAVVEDCVNAVGVDVNTASIALLKKISGLNETLAKNLVEYRDNQGKFQSRQDLLAIPRMGEKTFQQCAGFLRVQGGTQPLDASGVHPESYHIVEKILQQVQKPIHDVLGNLTVLNALNAAHFVDETHGLPTIIDIITELKKPGRDPRPTFKIATFREDIEDIKQIQKDMILEGVVGNVTHFGAFVDIGIHHNGLIHISEIPRSHQELKAGDVVTVRVIEVNLERNRIGLSLKLNESPIRKNDNRSSHHKNVQNNKPSKEKPIINSAMADALAKLRG